MHFPLAPKVAHMPARDPHRVSRAAGQAGEVLELGVHHHALLRASDRGPHGFSVEGVGDGGCRYFQIQGKGVAVGQVIDGFAAAVVGQIRLDAGLHQQGNDLAKMQLAAVGAGGCFVNQGLGAGVHSAFAM